MGKTAATAWPVSIRPAGGLLLLTLALASCDKANPVGLSAPPAGPQFSRLQITPDELELSEVGPSNSAALTTIAWDDRGLRMSNAEAIVAYSSSAPSVASVDGDGIVTARAPGTAEITVTMRIAEVVRRALARVTVVEAGPEPAFGGVYDLTALIVDSDSIWGIEAGTRQVAVVSIEHSVDGSRFTGTFSDFRALSPGGGVLNGRPGWVSGVVDGNGRVVLELTVEGTRSAYWRGEGWLDSSGMAGTFGAGGHITGTFTAVRR